MTWRKNQLDLFDSMMEKKYKLTDETISHYGKTLYRIEALRDFNDVKKGDKGGFIKSEKNLSHEGNCWVYNDAKVFENACVKFDAVVYDSAIINGSACISCRARVHKNAVVCDNVIVSGDSDVHGEVRLTGRAYIYNA